MRLTCLSPTQQAILEGFKRLHYATVNQLHYWSGVTLAPVRKSLLSLQAAGYVECEKQVRPHVWKLSRTGSRLVAQPLPSGFRQPSWSVMAHTCHRNQVEMVLRKRLSSFMFLKKTALFRLGLNPSHGEHAGTQAGKIFLILLDDYLMGSDRITKVLSRAHRKNPKYCNLNRSVNWNMVINRYLVVTTDPHQKSLHERWIKKQNIQAELVYLPPLWAY
ncbi:MAG: hypothetical protein ACE5FY_05935 [Nitrospiria bacterium]